MSLSGEEVRSFEEVLDSLHVDATFSAQTYFEASKRAEFWGKFIVFAPALISAFSGIVVALGWDKSWGVAAAAAGLVAATGSFLGAERKTPSYKESARKYTQLRHEVSMARKLIRRHVSAESLQETVRKLMDQYQAIVARDEPASSAAFKRASKRIKQGVTSVAPPADGVPETTAAAADQARSAPGAGSTGTAP